MRQQGGDGGDVMGYGDFTRLIAAATTENRTALFVSKEKCPRDAWWQEGDIGMFNTVARTQGFGPVLDMASSRSHSISMSTFFQQYHGHTPMLWRIPPSNYH